MRDYQTMSFNTAFSAFPLFRAKEMGLNVPAGMVADVANAIQRQRNPDGSFVYSSSHEKNAESILANLGSGSRTVSSALALYEIGIYDKRQLKQALGVFYNGENYLEQGRKLIQPHSAVHKISGYFFFFGYNYATEVATILKMKLTRNAGIGSLGRCCGPRKNTAVGGIPAAADYGDKWGTGFAIRTLQRYQLEMKRREQSRDENKKNEADKDAS